MMRYECVLWFYHWHWLAGAPEVVLACWGSVSLRLGRAAGQGVETLEEMEAGQVGVLVLLED